MTPLEPPDAFLLRFPMTDAMSELVADSREQIRRIINGENDRMLVLVGPCSIHDEKAGLEYARRLAELKKRVEDRIMIVMRVYFEKPVTESPVALNFPSHCLLIILMAAIVIVGLWQAPFLALASLASSSLF